MEYTIEREDRSQGMWDEFSKEKILQLDLKSHTHNST